MPNPRLIHSVLSVDFHRNGVAGESFHVVSFLTRERFGEHRDRRHLLGIVFDSPHHVAVVPPSASPLDLADRFRGDLFEAELQAAITAAASAGTVRYCSPYPEGVHA